MTSPSIVHSRYSIALHPNQLQHYKSIVERPDGLAALSFVLGSYGASNISMSGNNCLEWDCGELYVAERVAWVASSILNGSEHSISALSCDPLLLAEALDNDERYLDVHPMVFDKEQNCYTNADRKVPEFYDFQVRGDDPDEMYCEIDYVPPALCHAVEQIITELYGLSSVL